MTNWIKRGILVAIFITCACLIWLYTGGRGWLSTHREERPTRFYPPTCPATRNSSVPEHLQRYKTKLFSYPGIIHYECEPFTIVMMTYKRVSILPKVLHHYCKTPLLDKIIVIWNNVEEAIPSDLLKLNLSCAVPLLFIKEKENKMTNRFKARPEIKTECIMIIDDDRIIAHDDLVSGFKVWQQFRHRIVGFERRTHFLLPDRTYQYENHREAIKNYGYSIMIGATLIMHRVYLEMFFDPEVLPRAMFEYIDNIMNCDDLGICVMVTKFLEDVSWPQCGVLAVKPSVKIKNIQKAQKGFHGLVSQPHHYEQRSACLNKFTEFYNGTLYLHHTFGEISL